jgi:hypothetical protein
MKWPKAYQVILQECLARVLEGGESLDQVLNEYPHWRHRLALDIAAARWVRDRGTAYEPRPGFVTSTRQHLIGRLLSPHLKIKSARLVQPLQLRLSRLVLVLFFVMVILLAGAGTTLVAQDALPGESLYPLRTGVEELQLLLTFDPVKAAYLHLQFAQGHLVACAIRISQGYPEEARVALRNYERHMADMGRIVSLPPQGVEIPEDLFFDFNQVFLQDIGTLQVLLPGAF